MRQLVLRQPLVGGFRGILDGASRRAPIGSMPGNSRHCYHNSGLAAAGSTAIGRRPFRSIQSLKHAGQVRRMSTEQSFGDEGEGTSATGTYSEAANEHAVISTFDLFSIGIGPSSSHTVGPMRAGNIFVCDLIEAGLLDKVNRIRVSIYGSLALTGEGHMTPSSLLLGLEGADVETVDTEYVPSRFSDIKTGGKLFLGQGLPNGGGKEIDFSYDRDFIWEFGRKLPMHSNGMRLTVFDAEGFPLATNDLFSVGGGFVVNGALSTAPATDAHDPEEGGEPGDDQLAIGSSESPNAVGRHPADLAENAFYKELRRSDAAGDRRSGSEIKSRAVQDPGHMIASEELGPTGIVSASGSSKPTTDIESETAEEEPAAHKPRFPFHDATSLLTLCRDHNLTIAQLVFENEKSLGLSEDEIMQKVFRIWEVMDNCILEGVQQPVDSTLPGSLKLHRRAPALYKRLTRGLYPTRGNSLSDPQPKQPPSLLEDIAEKAKQQSGPPNSALLRSSSSGAQALSTAVQRRKRLPQRVHGRLHHPIAPSPQRRTTLPAMDYLTVYAIAVNETNAAGGRVVTAPTNGAAGIIPAVLKYTIEFISDDPERDIPTFLLTASAIGMLYKRGATISAAEGGCMAEVGVACSMAAGAFAACMGAGPETIEQAAEIGIEHNLGLTCDPIGGLVQAPCIERNALGAIKAISSANLALSSKSGLQKVRLDDAIRAMRLTAKGMRNEFKETSLSGLATSVPLNIPVSVPDC